MALAHATGTHGWPYPVPLWLRRHGCQARLLCTHLGCLPLPPLCVRRPASLWVAGEQRAGGAGLVWISYCADGSNCGGGGSGWGGVRLCVSLDLFCTRALVACRACIWPSGTESAASPRVSVRDRGARIPRPPQDVRPPQFLPMCCRRAGWISCAAAAPIRSFPLTSFPLIVSICYSRPAACDATLCAPTRTVLHLPLL